jgi:hypothetical protein
MREKTRQRMLRDRTGITRSALRERVASSSYRSWSGCLSGDDWSGTVVFLNGKRLSSGEHQQNSRSTGWERTGLHQQAGSPFVPKIGDRVVVKRRFSVGRNPAGDEMLTTETTTLTVV